MGTVVAYPSERYEVTATCEPKPTSDIDGKLARVKQTDLPLAFPLEGFQKPSREGIQVHTSTLTSSLKTPTALPGANS